MLVIRLARGGRTKYPVYRIVAAESARAATGKFVEVLGHYNPHTKDLVIKKEETERRLSNGAQPSDTVVRLLKREGIELPSWVKVKTKAPKVKDEPEAEAAVEPAVEEVAEATEDLAAEESPRVAIAATENAAEVEDNKTEAGETETAEITEAKADAAEQGSKAAADSATEAAE